MKKLLFLIAFTITTLSFSQNTFVPDDGLEGRLQQLGLDSGSLDDLVLTANINTLEDFDFSNFIVTDITGLQDFVSLKELSMIAVISDLSPIEGLTSLEELFISDATDTTLDLSELVNLTYLNINESALTSINLSNNTNLTEVSVVLTPITQITFSTNSLIGDMTIAGTQVQSLDLSELTQLTNLGISANPMLASIDISESSLLDIITVDDNAVLSSLDLSNNSALISVDVKENAQLTSIDIKNGNNTAIGQTFKVKDNPMLDCVQVDDAAWSWVNWGFPTDYFAGFSEDCSVTNNITEIPDVNFEQRLVTLGYDAGPANGMVHTPNIIAVTSLTANGANIADLTGIEDFTALETLRVFDNSLTTLDVSQNLELEDLRCFNNQLTALDVSNNTKLGDLRAFDNSIEILDLSNNGSLFSVKIYNNSLTSLNVKNGNNSNISTFEATGNSELTCIDVDDLNYAINNWTDIDSQTTFSLDCSSSGATVDILDAYFEEYLESIGVGNGIDFDGLADLTAVQALTSVDLSGLGTVESLSGIEFFTSLTSLNVSGNIIESVDLLMNTLLESLDVSDNSLTALNLSGNTQLTSVNASQNSIESIDLSANTLLFYFDISDNSLTSLDLSNNANLGSLTVSNNGLTTLDLTNSPDLEILRCNSNQLSELNVTENELLMELSCNSNSLVNLNLLSNTNLEELYAESNSLEYLDLSQNPSLTTVTVILNSLIGLNLKNGNNTAISNSSFAAFDNPSLTCVQVDDVAYSNSNWGQIDMATTFSENCTPVNDDCSFTIPITLGQDTPGDTTSASAGAGNPSCAQNGIVLFDIWYEVEAPASGSIVLNLSAQPLIAKIAIYNTCSDTQPFACDEDTLSVDNLTPGQTYYLQVWLESDPNGRALTGETGSFTLNAQDADVLSNPDVERESLNLQLFPNPAGDEVFIKLMNNDAINTVKIYSLLGEKVLEQTSQFEKIAVSDLSKGIYIVKVESVNGSYSKKLLKN